MARQRQDICVYVGESKTLLLTVFDEDGTLLDLTGSTVRFHVAPTAGATPVVTKTSATVTDIEILTQSGATLGQAKIYLQPSDTLPGGGTNGTGLFYYDVWVDLVTGEKHLVVPPSRFEVLAVVRP